MTGVGRSAVGARSPAVAEPGRRPTRRAFVANLLGLGAGLALLDLAEPFIAPLPAPATVPPVPAAELRLGGNFNALECSYMGMDPLEALDDVLRLNLDCLRVGARWDEIETRPDELDFGPLDAVLERCDRRGVPVILAIGIKTPVWPDFHIPDWVQAQMPLPPTGLLTRSPRLRDLGHRFARKVAERYAGASGISMLQVENEPFDPQLLAHAWSLDEPFLRRQVEIVRDADRLNRPILLTAFVSSHRFVANLQNADQRAAGRLLFGPLFGDRPNDALVAMADVVGFDVYPSIGWDMFGSPVYFRPTSLREFTPLLLYRDAVARAGKPTLVAECQAKPWEPGEKVHTGAETPSFAPEELPQLVARLAGFGFGEVLLWGLEHWVWHRHHGDPRWWETGSSFLERRELADPASVSRSNQGALG